MSVLTICGVTEIHHHFLHLEQALICGMDTVYTQYMRTILSPRHPMTYPTNFQCEWKIKVEENKVNVIRVI